MKPIKDFQLKNFWLLRIAVVLSVFFSACTKDTPEDISSSTTGSIVFWSNQPGSNITIKINGGVYTGSISKYTTGSTAPGCGDSGSYTVSLNTSTSYSYTATDGTHNWSGTFSLGTGCKSFLLYW